MRIFMAVIPVTLLSICIANAATIELSDGRRVQGEIVSRDDRSVVIQTLGGKVLLPRTMVFDIDDEDQMEALRPGEVKVLRAGEGPAVVIGSATRPVQNEQKAPRRPIDVTREPAPVVDEVQLPMPADPVALTNLQDALNSLRSNDPVAVASARQAFAEFGDEGLGVLARFGLYHESPTVRSASVFLLGNLGGEKALGVLIQAFYAAAHPTIQPYQVNFVEELTAQISRLTGVDFTFYPRQGNEAPVMARRMVEWWRANYAKLPRQLGEPELDPNDPDYKTSLWSLRNLPLERHTFAGFNLPPDFVPPAGPPTEVEAGYAATIPIIPRDLSLERGTSTSQTPAPDRTQITEPFTPGDWRRDLYLDRMLGEMQTGVRNRTF